MRIDTFHGFYINIMLWVPVIFLIQSLASCTDPSPFGGGDIVVLGDSVMAWNNRSGAAIPDVLGNRLARNVTSKAVAGAQFDNASRVASAVGFDIHRQLPGGRWNWVVMNGGANDVNADCGCGACGPVVDALIGPDANSGAIPSYIRKVQAQAKARVIWMGYYAGSGTGSFAGCRDDLVEMEARIARFARSTPGVYFTDAEDVIDRGDATLFAPDNIHPSPKGSALIGAHVARLISAIDPSSQSQR